MKRKWINFSIIIFGSIIVISIIVLIRANQPRMLARGETIELAKKYADLEQAEDFYWYAREKTYFSLVGRNQSGEEIIVIIPQTGEKVTIYQQKEGLTAEQVRAETVNKYPNLKIEKLALGFYENEPVWEVTGKTEEGYFNYYLLNFKTGEWLKSIENI